MKGDDEGPRGGVTATRYLEVLQEHLPDLLEYNTIFMQDNAPIHKARIIKEWFKTSGVYVVDWPPYSLDLNPIENLWKMLKAEIIRSHLEFITMKDNLSTKNHLIRCAMEAWDALKDGLLNKLALGMQKRVDVVIIANGWYTKY